MALLANQIMDARILSSMNGRVELSQFLRITNQSIVSQVDSTQDDSRKNRKYPCPLCGKRFRFNSILSLHMRTHTGEKPFKCPYCDHRAAQKGNLKIHLRTHKQGILGKGRGRIREENRLLHELEERAILRDRQMRGGKVSHRQMAVSNTSQAQEAFLQTVPSEPQFLKISAAAELHTPASKSPKATALPDEPIQPQTTGFRCSFCKGKFRKQQELERHIRILHKPYKCTLCEFAAAQEEELIGHVEMTHITADSVPGQKVSLGTSEKGKPAGEFPCEVCGQTFSQAWFLKGHMRKHKDSFEHCCQICGRRFKEPWFLKNHMKVHLNKLAAKSNVLTDRESSHDHPSKVYSEYISRIHNRFFTPDRADLPDYNHMMATAGADMKVREMLSRMISSGPVPLTETESSSSLGLNHLHPPLSSTSVEYLQKVLFNRDAVNNSSSSSYAAWQIIPPGVTIDQQIFKPKDHVAQQQHCPPARNLISDEANMHGGDRNSQILSRPGSPGSHVAEEMIMETGPSQLGSTPEHPAESSSPAAGENVYRCPLSGDFTAAQTAPVSFHLDPFHFPHWQNNRDLSSPLQPSASSSSSPNPKQRPRSRDDWSPAAGQFLSLDSGGEEALHLNKQRDNSGKDSDGSVPGQSKKSQYEPLDLSVRPESVSVSPAALGQMSGLYGNGLSSSLSRRLQSYSAAPAELGMKPAYQCDLLVPGTTEKINPQNVGPMSHEVGKSDQEKEDKNEDSTKWKMLTNDGSETKEPGFEKNPKQLGQWARVLPETPVSSFESLTPGMADSFLHQEALLSFFRAPANVNGAPVGAHKASVNGGGNIEKDVASARKPFHCKYCPYSASQKGNLKTHVLCVHRKPFDNSLYPDRRLRRAQPPQAPPTLPLSVTGDNRASSTDQIAATSLCGT